jgi:hypothetical protein
LGDARHHFAALSTPDIASLQTTVRNTVTTLATAHDAIDGYLLPEFHVTGLTFAPALAGSDVILTIDGPPRDVFLYLFALLLREVGVKHVRRCRDLNCGVVFVKVGRREYCSLACQKRYSLRAWRRSLAERERRKGKRHGKTRKR